MNQNFQRYIGILLLAVSLAGCGVKGALYLPEKDKASSVPNAESSIAPQTSQQGQSS